MVNVEDVIKNVAGKEQSGKKKIEETVQLVVFELDKEEYAVEIKDLQEIIRIPEITPVPNAPEFIRGIFNLRGKIVVVVDLEKRFNLIRENNGLNGNIIITESENNNYGVIVDKVTEIKNIPIDTIQSTPVLLSAKIHSDYLKGVIVIKDNEEGRDGEKDKGGEKDREEDSRLIVLLDLTKLLQEKELMSLGKTVEKVVEGEE